MKQALMCVAALTGAALAASAHAQAATDSSWYVRGDVGAAFQPELNATPKVKGDTGWTVDAAAGRSFGAFRTEGELLYSQADRKVGDGQTKVLAGMLNGYYDFDTGTPFKPFVGAGVGLGQVKLDDGRTSNDDTGLAYQLQTGVAYPINDRLSAQVAYRYLGVNDVKIRSGASSLRGDYHDQALVFGVTYKLGR